MPRTQQAALATAARTLSGAPRTSGLDGSARLGARCRRPSFLSGLGGVLCLALLAVGLASLAAAPLAAEPTCKLDPKELTICVGPYALCDKSTCKKAPSGDNVECTCPVLHGPSIASLDQLGGKCAPPDKGTVYSLFSLQGYGQTMGCPTGSQFAQCWNATCKLLPGAKKAVCTCPLCPGPFVTPGGACNPTNCQKEIMVGAAFPVQGSGCKTK